MHKSSNRQYAYHQSLSIAVILLCTLATNSAISSDLSSSKLTEEVLQLRELLSPFIGWKTYVAELEKVSSDDTEKAARFFSSHGVKDFDQLRKKAERADANTAHAMYLCYAKAVGVRRDMEIAIQWLRRAADSGHSTAQKDLAFRLIAGFGVPMDGKEGTQWLQKAAEQEGKLGNSELAYCYLVGIGVAQDEQKAVSLYRENADYGFGEATISIDGIAIDLRQGIISGDTNSQAGLAFCYEHGVGVARNMEEARKWIESAAYNGSLYAQIVLGTYLYESAVVGVNKTKLDNSSVFEKYEADNKAKAYQWLSLATIQMKQKNITMDGLTPNIDILAANMSIDELSDGYHKMGQYYLRRGSDDDAFQWYQKAAEMGHALAQAWLGLEYFYGGRLVKKDESEGVKWLLLAANQGLVMAQIHMGLCYGSGLGVTKDYIEAYKWLNLAAGIAPDAGEHRDALEQQMTVEQIAEAQQRSANFLLHSRPNSKQPQELESRFATAFMITSNGFAVTAAHAVESAHMVTLSREGRMYSARVVALDSANDLALLKVAETNLNAISIKSSSQVKLGEEVCTVGFPNLVMQGIAPKVTRGYINSLSGIQDSPRSFQISAQVQPGNSGGALVDMGGKVVGVVVSELDAIASFAITGSLPQNVNYAIKSSYLLALIEALPEVSQALAATTFPVPKTPEETVIALEKATYLLSAE